MLLYYLGFLLHSQFLSLILRTSYCQPLEDDSVFLMKLQTVWGVDSKERCLLPDGKRKGEFAARLPAGPCGLEWCYIYSTCSQVYKSFRVHSARQRPDLINTLIDSKRLLPLAHLKVKVLVTLTRVCSAEKPLPGGRWRT